MGAGSGNLPTNAQNPLTLAQLNTLFAGVAGTQNMALNWNMAFNITPVTFAGNNNTFTPAPWFSNMRLFLIANPALNVTITGNTNFAPSASNPIPIGTGAAVWGHIPLGGTFSDGVGVAAIFGIDVSVQNMGNLMLLRAAAVAINLRTGIPNPGRVAIQRGANGPGANITITIGGVNVNSIP